MIGRPGWVVARWVRRAAWWVFVVVALVAGRVSWFGFSQTPEVTYHGSYQPLNGVTDSSAYGTALTVSDVVEGGVAWAGPVTAAAAAVVVVAAIVQADAAHRGALMTVLLIAIPVVAVLTVIAAVNSIDGVLAHPELLIAVVLGATAILEAATAVARPTQTDP
ncbi:MAG: hypothetical protein INR72_08450 [Williamsia herbipolensis]|nr:hypothetical protein [Williamsia herbipolensis]